MLSPTFDNSSCTIVAIPSPYVTARAAWTRWKFTGNYADSGLPMLPIHFPIPTAGTIAANGERLPYHFTT